MLKKMVIIVTIVFSLVSSKDGSIPEWYINPPKEDGLLFGVGSGDMKMKAILMTLVEIGQNRLVSPILNGQKYESTVTALTDTVVEFNKQILFFSLGDFTFDIMIEKGTMGKTGKKMTELAIKLMFSLDGIKSNINYYFKEEGETILSDHLEIFCIGMDEETLIDELDVNGLDLKFARDLNGNYFALASIESDLVK